MKNTYDFVAGGNSTHSIEDLKFTFDKTLLCVCARTRAHVHEREYDSCLIIVTLYLIKYYNVFLMDVILCNLYLHNLFGISRS